MTNLELMRRTKGMNQFTLAEKSRLSQSWISRFESQKYNIDHARIETLCDLADALEVKLWDILEDETLRELMKSAVVGGEREHDTWYDGTRLREMRELMEISQTELASEMDTTQSNISRWETEGLENARIETIGFFCIYLNCHPCDLIDNENLRNKIREVL